MRDWASGAVGRESVGTKLATRGIQKADVGPSVVGHDLRVVGTLRRLTDRRFRIGETVNVRNHSETSSAYRSTRLYKSRHLPERNRRRLSHRSRPLRVLQRLRSRAVRFISELSLRHR